MATITLTTLLANQIGTMSWGIRRADVATESVFGSQIVEISGPRWLCDFTIPPRSELDAGVWKALLLRLKGRNNLLELWDVRRPAPKGTMRGAMTLKANAAAGAESIQISAGVGQANTTLREGDWLQIGTGATQHLLMVTEPATADGLGDITVNIGHPLRNAFALGSAVTWDRAKGLFRMTENEKRWDYAPGVVNGFGMSLVEDWRV